MRPAAVAQARKPVTLGLALVFLLTAEARAERCMLPADLGALTVTLSALATQGGGAVDPGARKDLSRLLAALPEARMVESLDDRDLHGLVPVALELLSESAQIVSTGTVRRPERLSMMLQDLGTRLDGACAPNRTGWFLGSGSGGAQGETGEEGGGAAENDAPPGTVATRAGALFAVLLAMIGLIYGLDGMIRWATTLVFNRKTCRIPACVVVDGLRLDGAVVTLGRGGFRFEPADPDAYTRRASQLQASAITLSVDGEAIAAKVSQMHAECFDCRFEKRMGAARQKTLFARSIVHPVYVRRSRRRFAARGAKA